MKLINKNFQNKRKYTINSLETYNLALRLREEKGWGAIKIKRYLDKTGITTSIYSIDGWIHHNKKPFSHK